jgi:hypothetical protein
MQQGDSLDNFQATRQEILDGPSSIRERDARMAQFETMRTQPVADNSYRAWPSSNMPGPTKAFKPNGSFQALRDSGKLVTGEREISDHLKAKHFIPGYTGFIRGRQHISGRTYGECTRRAYDTSYTEHVTTSPIPSGPQANRRVPQEALEDRFMYGIHKNKAYHCPGYTGHVPGARARYSNTFGSTTRDCVEQFHQMGHPRPNPQERPAFAYTSFPRQNLHIDSSPIPGAVATHKSPIKLIPRKMEYVQFFAM